MTINGLDIGALGLVIAMVAVLGVLVLAAWDEL